MKETKETDSLIPVTIDGNKWMRGGSIGNHKKSIGVSYLYYKSDDYKNEAVEGLCCLGFCALATGAPVGAIDHVAYPIGVVSAAIHPLFSVELHPVCREAASRNDAILYGSDYVTDAKRIALLTPILRQLGFEPTFINCTRDYRKESGGDTALQGA